MPKFLFAYRSLPFDPSQISPEEMQQSLGRWMDWIGKGMQEGWMVEGGDALLPVGSVVDKNSVVTDGPFVEAKEILGGYSIIKSNTLQEAIAIAKTCPNILEGGSVEIRQCAEFGESKD